MLVTSAYLPRASSLLVLSLACFSGLLLPDSWIHHDHQSVSLVASTDLLASNDP
uniref:Uncharacterized protein n=1 Tax=Arundo donax TaxID=35708 RepID=A0A0A9BXF0_ARUDO